jgi:hypothetical protein
VAPFNTDKFFDKALGIKPEPRTKDEPRFAILKGRSVGTTLVSDLTIPGFNSDDAASFPGGPDAYREELHRRNGTKPRPQYKLNQKPIDEEVDNMEATPVTPEEEELAKLVGQYESAFSETPGSFMLTAPGKHTTKNGKEFKIRPFIGGEEFTPVRAYVGKKKGTIIVFKPTYPCDFEFLEIPEKQCKSAFGAAFPIYMHEVLKDVMAAKEEIAAQARKAEEIERNAAAAESYQEFGSW